MYMHFPYYENASDFNVVCWSRLLHVNAYVRDYFRHIDKQYRPWSHWSQSEWSSLIWVTLIGLFLDEQSDLSPHCV